MTDSNIRCTRKKAEDAQQPEGLGELVLASQQPVVVNGQNSYESFSLCSDASMGGTAYFVSNIVTRIEHAVIDDRDNELYKATLSLANQFFRDKNLGIITALGVYSLLKELGKNAR